MEEKILHLSAPFIHKDAVNLLSKAIHDGWISPVGPVTEAFEEMLSDFFSAKYAIAVNSGTSALHLGLKALGVTKGDVVLVPSITFIATANAVSYCGARPVFIDCDKSDMNISVSLLRNFFYRYTERKKNSLILKSTGEIVKAIIPVDVLGNPCSSLEITGLAREYGIKVLQDATESMGSLFNDKPAGSFADAFVVSFNGNKMMTTGSGGALLTNNKRLYQKAIYLSMQAKDDGLYYVHNEIGFNYRMPCLNAAFGISQLNNFDLHLKAKRRLGELYNKAFKGIKGIRLIKARRGSVANNWLNAVYIEGEKEDKKAARKRDKILNRLRSNGIMARPLWMPVRKQKPYEDCLFAGRGNDMHMFSRIICLPSDFSMTGVDVDRVAGLVKG